MAIYGKPVRQLMKEEMVQGLEVIIGAKNDEQLTDNLAAPGIELSVDELARLDKVSVLPPEYPGWMLRQQAQGRYPVPPQAK